MATFGDILQLLQMTTTFGVYRFRESLADAYLLMRCAEIEFLICFAIAFLEDSLFVTGISSSVFSAL